MKLLARFVQADHVAFLDIRPLLDVQYVLHPVHELGAPLRREAPHLLQPRLDLMFFRTVRTVSSEIDSATSGSTDLSARSGMVHTAWSSGGGERARAIGRASPRPS